ncbi:aminopeptidase [Candidatus Woesearchaeota archaeon]|nr:aminopeptidase [Candidatus Woesearchaeota archaeon]
MGEDIFNLLGQENLMHHVEGIVPTFRRILDECVGEIDRDFLIVTDIGYETRRVPLLIAYGYFYAARELGLEPRLAAELPRQFGIGPANPAVVDSLDTLPGGSLIVVCLSGKLGKLEGLSKSFRGFVKRRKHRFISTPGLTHFRNSQFPHLLRSLDVDYRKMHACALRIKEQLDAGKEVHIWTDRGTDLIIDIRGMSAVLNSGNFTKDSGSIGGNIPAGEVYIPPNGRGAEGTVVIDGSIRTEKNTVLLGEPVAFKVRRGILCDIDRSENGQLLERTLQNAAKIAKYPHSIRRIGELGIGINPNASICGPTVINEKTLGTAHIANGSNAWFGGDIYSIVHLDHVFRDPKIEVDGTRLEY